MHKPITQQTQSGVLVTDERLGDVLVSKCCLQNIDDTAMWLTLVGRLLRFWSVNSLPVGMYVTPPSGSQGVG